MTEALARRVHRWMCYLGLGVAEVLLHAVYHRDLALAMAVVLVGWSLAMLWLGLSPADDKRPDVVEGIDDEDDARS